MPHIFERVSSRKYANPKLISVCDLSSRSELAVTIILTIICQSQNTQEQPLTGSSKISYRPGEDWDFEGCTESALIDVNLVMPPYRPKTQPEHHRTSMYLGSESGPIKARVVSASAMFSCPQRYLHRRATVPTLLPPPLSS